VERTMGLARPAAWLLGATAPAGRIMRALSLFACREHFARPRAHQQVSHWQARGVAQHS